MNVAIIGDGGREDALRFALRRSPFVRNLYSVSSSVAISDLLRFVEEKAVEFTVVGGETLLVQGIADAFAHAGKRIFGPSKAAAILEGSKVFCKRFLQRHHIPTAGFQVFENSKPEENAKSAKKFIDTHGCPLVLKADGLAAGKGVTIIREREQGHQAIDRLLQQPWGKQFLLEEFLSGVECSYIVFTDGVNIVPLRTVKDYKELYPGGPMTGGMGCISPHPLVTEAMQRQIQEQITKPFLAALRKEGIVYRGALYIGLMLTPWGPKVLEINCRLGDPETQVTLPFLASPDILPLLYGTIHDNGLKYYAGLQYKSPAAVCVVLAQKGYPDIPSGDYPQYPIVGLEQARKVQGITIFHAGTRHPPYEYLTAGGRVLNVVGTGNTLTEARANAYRLIQPKRLEDPRISFADMYYRDDIGA